MIGLIALDTRRTVLPISDLLSNEFVGRAEVSGQDSSSRRGR